MDTKLLAAVVIVFVALSTVVAYFYISPSQLPLVPSTNTIKAQAIPPVPIIPNPIDPNNKYDDYQVEKAKAYSFDAFIIGKNKENLTFRTNQRIITVTKPASVGYFLITKDGRLPIRENELQQNEPVRVTVVTGLTKSKVEALSVTAVRE